MDNRREAQNLIDRYSIDKEALLAYILDNWMSGDDVLDAVHSYVEDELDIDLSDNEDEEDW